MELLTLSQKFNNLNFKHKFLISVCWWRSGFP